MSAGNNEVDCAKPVATLNWSFQNAILEQWVIPSPVRPLGAATAFPWNSDEQLTSLKSMLTSAGYLSQQSF